MPILSFSSRQIDLITGEKNMTIRKLWKKPLKVGDRLHCYWNLISKERQKVFEAEVTSVEIIKFKDLIKDDKLAQEDGFKDAEELKREFERIYGELDDETKFQIIRFKRLPINEWEGEKIDQKAMIIQKADILFDLGKYKESKTCYNAALKLDPENVYILNRLQTTSQDLEGSKRQ